MTAKCRLLFLGTGGSMGIPVIGCDCQVCQSTSKFNKRLRPSVLLSCEEKKILIDSGPDFRFQALKYGIKDLNGVIYTHAHHDHTAGLDELRILTFRSGKPLPCLLSQETLEDLKFRYYYIFDAAPDLRKLTANIQPCILNGTKGEAVFQGLQIQYNSYEQGGMAVNGFRFGDLAYLTDLRDFDDDIFSMLKNLKTLIISSLRFTPSYLHLSIDEAVEFAQRVNAEQTWFTHIAHELDHEKTNAYLPDNIRLAYDGLELEFDADWE
jgi:phosphoribosyl 1,2-cyclic phosphate phosphodiesterase